MTPSTRRFVIDSKGNKVAVLIGMAEYERMAEMVAELELIRGYEASGSGHDAAAFAQAPERADELDALGLRSFP